MIDSRESKSITKRCKARSKLGWGNISLADSEIRAGGEIGLRQVHWGQPGVHEPAYALHRRAGQTDEEELPIWVRKDNSFRFEKCPSSTVCYERMNPPARSQDVADLLATKKIVYRNVAMIQMAAKPGGALHDVLNMYPIELSGGIKQRMVMVLSPCSTHLCSSPMSDIRVDFSTQKSGG